MPTGGSTLMSRLWLAMRAGLSFGGKRDYYEIFGYERNITPVQMLAKYERQDITQRVVESAPDALWAYPPELEDASPEVATAWEGMLKKGLLSAFLQADRLLAFDQFSVLWLGLPGSPNLPARNAKIEDIKYISAHGAGAVDVVKFEENAQDERFGLPLIYRIRIDRPGLPQSSGLAKEVHWTRIVHIVDRPLNGRLVSKPRLAPMYNLLDDILKVAGSSAETFWLVANRGMQVDIDKEMQLGAEDEAALSAELDEYQHQLRRTIRTRGVKINSLGTDPVDPNNVFMSLIGLLAAASNIPQRILLGAEAGQLASAQDRANWAEYIGRLQRTFAEPYVLLPFFQRMEGLGIIPKGLSEGLKYKWPDPFHQNPLEESQTMSAKARALVNLSRQSQYGTPYVGQKEGRVWLGLPPDLPPDDQYLIVEGSATGKKKEGGSPESGGAGGNDGSGDSGGGAQQTDTTPVHEGTADRTSN